MAFDGVTVANIVKELKETLLGSRIAKIAQPEPDELLLTMKTAAGQRRLYLSASASLPLIYLTETNKPSPMTAPGFCMLLRKHLQNGRILDISQPGLERIINIDIEHLDEMGDLRRKRLVVEIMGKHSNIIFCNEENVILDSIKHVSGLVSSVREVLPGKPYFIPKTQDKADPLSLFRGEKEDGPRENTRDAADAGFRRLLSGKPMPVYKAIYNSFTGISPILAQELCFEAGVDGDLPTAALSREDFDRLCQAFVGMISSVLRGEFAPCIAYEGSAPAEYAALPLTMYASKEDTQAQASGATSRRQASHLEFQPSMSVLLESYYAEKNTLTRIRQKSSDLRRITQTALERNVKKYDLQLRQMKDTEKRDTYRIYGELLNTYGYNAQPKAKSLEALNYHTGEMITIPLDPGLTPQENAQKYFEKYNKMKRTYEALSELTEEGKAEIRHLESILASLDIALQEEDLVEIREELTESGYLRRKGGSKKVKVTSKPFHYLSSDGFHIYVGKNNYQNDELTFKFASGNDWWFHAKGIPGSHVVVKMEGAEELPDRTFEEAGRLAAYYSKGRGQDKVEIDYIQKKHVKKPGSAKPGFVVYYTNYSLMIDSDISGIQRIT